MLEIDDKTKDKDVDKKATIPLIARKVETEKKWDEKWEDEEDIADDIELGESKGSKDSKDDYKTKIESLPAVDKNKVLGMFQNQKKQDVKTATTPSSAKKPNLLIPTTPQGVDLFASTGIVAKPKFTDEKEKSSSRPSSKWDDEEELLDE